MKTDLRGFVYSLEPIRRKNQWQLDNLLGKLSRVQKAIDDVQSQVDAIRKEHADVARKAAAAMSLRIDLDVHRHALSYLSQLNEKLRVAEDPLASLLEQRNELRDACAEQQKKLELSEQHRERCLKEFINVAESLQNTEADRNWNARDFWRAAAQKTRPHGRESRRKEPV